MGSGSKCSGKSVPVSADRWGPGGQYSYGPCPHTGATGLRGHIGATFTNRKPCASTLLLPCHNAWSYGNSTPGQSLSLSAGTAGSSLRSWQAQERRPVKSWQKVNGLSTLCCVILSKLFSISELQLPRLQHGVSNP